MVRSGILVLEDMERYTEQVEAERSAKRWAKSPAINHHSK